MNYMEKFDAICAAIEAEGLDVTLDVQQIVEIALKVTERAAPEKKETTERITVTARDETGATLCTYIAEAGATEKLEILYALGEVFDHTRDDFDKAVEDDLRRTSAASQ
jgi:hypothetical protein